MEEAKSLDERIHKGMLKYLEFKGYDVHDEDCDGFIVAYDPEENAVAFISTTADCDDFCNIKEEHPTRKQFEQAINKFFKSHQDIADVNIRYDMLIMSIIESHRGIIKHYINADESLKG